MDFEWDEEKSDANLRERGFDFAFASLIFDGPTLEKEDQRKEYGEKRIVAMGVAEGIQVTLVYTDRVVDGKTVRRIISARKSNRRERKTYEEAF
jgi:uncharacterized protein